MSETPFKDRPEIDHLDLLGAHLAELAIDVATRSQGNSGAALLAHAALQMEMGRVAQSYLAEINAVYGEPCE